jgi:4-amino-4-deoxy-L-arabinose transferase-like glycosyltransferase
LAERQTIPRVGQTVLSPEIAASTILSGRWEHFHWPAPASQKPEDWGLEGQSYEGYQPPLYYLLLAPLFAALPGGILTKLYALRWASVGLSLLTIFFAYRIGRKLVPPQASFAYAACILLAIIPERIASISRVNNDVLLEVIGAALILVCTQAVLDQLSISRSRLLGLLLGFGLLTKSAAIVFLVPIAVTLWTARRRPRFWRHVAWVAGIAFLLVVPWAVRNLLVYGDPTGFGSFNKITNFAPPVVTGQTIRDALWDLFRHFWLVWWKGARPGGNRLLTGFDFLLLVASVLSVVGIVRSVCLRSCDKPRLQVIAMFALTVGACAVAVVTTYLRGQVPVIQGRFLLPAIVPAVILLAWGLWHVPHGRVVLAAVIGLLVLFGCLALFGNLLPFYYYWSVFASGHAPEPSALRTLGQRWDLFYPRLLADKPVGLRPFLIWHVLGYVVILGAVGWMTARESSGKG